MGAKVAQAVIINITLSDHALGSTDDRFVISQLEDKISSALEEADFGELDGDEYGGGECTIYIYGPYADRLFEIVKPFLASDLKSYKGYVIKQYGNPDDPDAREIQVTW